MVIVPVAEVGGGLPAPSVDPVPAVLPPLPVPTHPESSATKVPAPAAVRNRRRSSAPSTRDGTPSEASVESMSHLPITIPALSTALRSSTLGLPVRPLSS